MSRATGPLDTFIELVETLVTAVDPDDLLQVLVQRCVGLLEVDTAGVLLAEPSGRLRVAATSGPDMRQLEIFQTAVREGPSVEALRTGTAVLEPDLRRAARRWPSFAPVALELDLVAGYGFPLRLRAVTLGALNLFQARGRAPLDEVQARTAQALAHVAALGLLHERLLDDAEARETELRHALDARVVVEQAKGLIAGRLSLTPAEALERLRGYARDHNRILRDVARDVIDGRLRIR